MAVNDKVAIIQDRSQDPSPDYRYDDAVRLATRRKLSEATDLVQSLNYNELDELINGDVGTVPVVILAVANTFYDSIKSQNFSKLTSIYDRVLGKPAQSHQILPPAQPPEIREKNVQIFVDEMGLINRDDTIEVGA